MYGGRAGPHTPSAGFPQERELGSVPTRPTLQEFETIPVHFPIGSFIIITRSGAEIWKARTDQTDQMSGILEV